MKTKKYFILLLAVLLAIMVMGSVSATDDDKYVSTTGLDSNTGDSFDTAYLTIQKGLDNVSNAGTVHIEAGTYTGPGNTNLDVKTAEVTISGAGQDQTIIDGQNTNQVLVVNPGEKVTIQDLTIQNGSVNGDGGGINNDGDLTIDNCKISGNTASQYGGGIFNRGTLAIDNSNITGNHAVFNGGGIHNHVVDGTITITNTYITENNATHGGGIFNQYGTINVIDSHIHGNTATYGGGINNYYNTASMNIIGSTINENTATLTGGGLYIYDSSMTISGSTIQKNSITATTTTGTVYARGGGVYQYRGTLIIYNSNIQNNTANASSTSGNAYAWGGGIFNDYYGTLNITESNILNNTAIATTITGFTSALGGGIFNQGILIVNYNRIIGNSPMAYSMYSSSTAGMKNVEYNWWGLNNPDFATLIVGPLDYTPWLYMTINTNPNIINNGETSLITASFNNYSSNGNTYTPLPEPLAGHIPDGTPVTFNTDLGNIGSKTIQKTTSGGLATATLTADDTAGTAHVNAVTDSQPVNTEVTINAKSSLYLTVTPNIANPVVGDTVIYTLKVGNKGPDTAKDVVMTYVVPEGLIFAGANVDNGTYTYDPNTRTITWTIGDVPVGDPYMWLSLRVASAGTYLINPLLSTSTYDPTLNQNTQSLTVNAATVTSTSVQAASSTNSVGMQTTGSPIVPLALAVLSVFFGLAKTRKKQEKG
ncbi:MAG TPA: DUF11 domain-containing protein [Methanobacterium sp.]|nr:DUF11 domain-containing protein [Methanobacterium sp.]